MSESVLHFEQLRRQTDVKKWINAAVSAVHGKDSAQASGRSAAGNTEEALRSVLSSVQLHSQQLGAVLESQISQTITRLPRTSLELSHMMADAVELHKQMKALESLACSSSAKSVSYLTKLSELKSIQNKLQGCATVLAQVNAVELGIKELDSLRSVRKISGTGTNALDDIIKLAEHLYNVKSGLEEIRKVEADFGSHFNLLLAEYEQIIQDQLEEQCFMEFVAHNDAKASELFLTLYRIRRSSAVLQRFHAHIAKTVVGRCVSAPVVDNYTVFARQFARCFANCLIEEAKFWIKMESRFVDVLDSPNIFEGPKIVFVIDILKELAEVIEIHVKPKLIPILENAECNDLLHFLCVVKTGELEIQEISAEYITNVKSIMENLVVKLLRDRKVIQRFCDKLMLKFRSTLQRDRFTWSAVEVAAAFDKVASALSDSCDAILSFFPEETAAEVMPMWKSSLESLMSSMEIHGDADQAAVLESLTLFIKQLRPSVIQCRTIVSGHLSEVHACSDDASVLRDKMVTNLWNILLQHIDQYIQQCQEKVKDWILQPLLEKTAEYKDLPVWRVSSIEQNHVAYKRGHTSATKPVRELGEAIIEIPVMLDQIRSRGVASASNKVWMEEVIEDVSESWLDEVVCASVSNFVTNHVLPLEMSFSSPSEAAPTNTASSSVEAWEQLKCDISYLQKVVSAVRDEGVDALDAVFDRFQRCPPPTCGRFTVQQALYGNSIR